MELQEKSGLAREKPHYDAIPLIILNKAGEKYVRVDTEDLRYRAISPHWMKFRLLLFWMLWIALIIAIMMSFLAQFWHIFVPRIQHNQNTHRNVNLTDRS